MVREDVPKPAIHCRYCREVIQQKPKTRPRRICLRCEKRIEDLRLAEYLSEDDRIGVRDE